MPYRTLARKPIARVLPFRVEVSLDQESKVDADKVREYVTKQLMLNRSFGCSVAVKPIEKERQIGGSLPKVLSELLGVPPQAMDEIECGSAGSDKYAEIARAYFNGTDQAQKERHVIHLLSILLKEA